MARSLLNIFLIIGLLLVPPLGWADFQAGQDAYDRGDYQTALKILLPLAQQGADNAQNALGNMYALGEGVPQNDTEATKWYRRAADQGNGRAQFNLGVTYHQGIGVQQDYTEAVRWYRLAIKNKHCCGAQINLGSLYMNGKGVPQDYDEAARLVRIGAEKGIAIGQAALGLMYGTGKGVQQDIIQAYMWETLSVEQGHKPAQKLLEMLEKVMTPTQLAQARRMAREWKPKGKQNSES
jgi:uncharacterized protein